MKLILCSLLLCSASSLVAGEEKAPVVTSEQKAEWTSLFDGKTLNGWKGYNKAKPGAAWQVIDGVIELTGNGGELITEKQYENYELELEWSFKEGTKRANSGIFIGGRETKSAIYTNALEMQVLINKAFPKVADLNVAGACYGLYPAKREWARGITEWNKVRIVCDGTKVEMRFNGHEVANFDSASADFKAMIAKTKFKKWTDFSTFSKGHIGFQDHGDSKGLRLRNIKIRSLK